jgi:hypothetical protein
MGSEIQPPEVIIPWLPHGVRDAIAVLHDPNASPLARALAASIVEVVIRHVIERLGFLPEEWLRLVAEALSDGKEPAHREEATP